MLFYGDQCVGIKITAIRALILCSLVLSTKLDSACHCIRDSDLTHCGMLCSVLNCFHFMCMKILPVSVLVYVVVDLILE